jgi:hypothetical protein
MTYREYIDPANRTRPMNDTDSFIRLMILEQIRRNLVMDGRQDPTPNEPWRICDPAELKAWIKRGGNPVKKSMGGR